MPLKILSFFFSSKTKDIVWTEGKKGGAGRKEKQPPILGLLLGCPWKKRYWFRNQELLEEKWTLRSSQGKRCLVRILFCFLFTCYFKMSTLPFSQRLVPLPGNFSFLKNESGSVSLYVLNLGVEFVLQNECFFKVEDPRMVSFSLTWRWPVFSTRIGGGGEGVKGRGIENLRIACARQQDWF